MVSAFTVCGCGYFFAPCCWRRRIIATPAELIDLIEAKGRELAEVLAELRATLPA
jgi:hypothetical protein